MTAVAGSSAITAHALRAGRMAGPAPSTVSAAATSVLTTPAFGADRLARPDVLPTASAAATSVSTAPVQIEQVVSTDCCFLATKVLSSRQMHWKRLCLLIHEDSQSMG